MFFEKDDISFLLEGRCLVGGSRGDIDSAKFQLMDGGGWAGIAGLANSAIGFGRLSPSPLGRSRRPRIRPLMVKVPKGPVNHTGPEPGMSCCVFAGAVPMKPLMNVRAISPLLELVVKVRANLLYCIIGVILEDDVAGTRVAVIA